MKMEVFLVFSWCFEGETLPCKACPVWYAFPSGDYLTYPWMTDPSSSLEQVQGKLSLLVVTEGYDPFSLNDLSASLPARVAVQGGTRLLTDSLCKTLPVLNICGRRSRVGGRHVDEGYNQGQFCRRSLHGYDFRLIASLVVGGFIRAKRSLLGRATFGLIWRSFQVTRKSLIVVWAEEMHRSTYSR